MSMAESIGFEGAALEKMSSPAGEAFLRCFGGCIEVYFPQFIEEGINFDFIVEFFDFFESLDLDIEDDIYIEHFIRCNFEREVEEFEAKTFKNELENKLPEGHVEKRKEKI